MPCLPQVVRTPASDVGRAALGLLALLLVRPSSAPGEEINWAHLPSTHFIVQYQGAEDTVARSVSERAESYYADIASDLGYTRYQNFWLWDHRVTIRLYPSAAAFTLACHAPAWAIGRADYDAREIDGYVQSREAFLTTLLPHEMTHLILADFIGRDRLPLWLNEGFAQWEQLRHQGSILPLGGREVYKLEELMRMDIRHDADTRRVALFYAQTASVVGFLIRQYGGEAFGNLCRQLRDGKSCDAALAATYHDAIPSTAALEAKWLKSLTP